MGQGKNFCHPAVASSTYILSIIYLNCVTFDRVVVPFLFILQLFREASQTLLQLASPITHMNVNTRS